MSATQRSITFPSVIENIHLVERLIDEIVAQYHVKEDHYGELLIAMTEAVNNAIVHGNRLDVSKQVSVHFDVVDDTVIRFTIEDEGPGFDYNTLPDPTAPENLLKDSGRGVFLMKNLADEVEFLNTGSVVNLYFHK